MIKNKVVVITGCSRGIGSATAELLLNEGFTVIATARKLESIQHLAIHKNCFVFALDVTSAKSCSSFAYEVEKQVDRIDVVINNAGVMHEGSLLETAVTDLKAAHETNFYGPLNVVKATLTLLKKSDAARIINISSQMSQLANLQSNHAAYRLSKWSLNGLTIILSKELQQNDILVVAACPGWVKTDMGGQNAPSPVSEGAKKLLWLATVPNLETGKLYSDFKVSAW